MQLQALLEEEREAWRVKVATENTARLSAEAKLAAGGGTTEHIAKMEAKLQRKDEEVAKVVAEKASMLQGLEAKMARPAPPPFSRLGLCRARS